MINFRTTKDGKQWPMPFWSNLKLHPLISLISWVITISILWPILLAVYLSKLILKNVSSPKLKYGLVATTVLFALFINSAWAAGIINPPHNLNQTTSNQNDSKSSNNSKSATKSAVAKTEETSDDEGSSVHDNSPATPAETTTIKGCDQSLWTHVYHPSRLKILDNCKSVSGKVDVVRKEADGDYHILLKLDSQFSSLINAKNTQYEQGDLVLEPVCVGTVTQTDAIASCENFHSNVTIPSVGSHVTVTGSYVLDQDHGWNEIHPVSSIENYVATQTNTAPTPTPTPAPTTSTGLSITFASVSSPISKGSYASVSISTSAGASCSITVTYNSGPSQASGLEPQTANGSGGITWSWKVGTKTASGTYPISVNCSSGGQSASKSTSFTVN